MAKVVFQRVRIICHVMRNGRVDPNGPDNWPDRAVSLPRVGDFVMSMDGAHEAVVTKVSHVDYCGPMAWLDLKLVK